MILKCSQFFLPLMLEDYLKKIKINIDMIDKFFCEVFHFFIELLSNISLYINKE